MFFEFRILTVLVTRNNKLMTELLQITPQGKLTRNRTEQFTRFKTKPFRSGRRLPVRVTANYRNPVSRITGRVTHFWIWIENTQDFCHYNLLLERHLSERHADDIRATHPMKREADAPQRAISEAQIAFPRRLYQPKTAFSLIILGFFNRI